MRRCGPEGKVETTESRRTTQPIGNKTHPRQESAYEEEGNTEIDAQGKRSGIELIFRDDETAKEKTKNKRTRGDKGQRKTAA